MNKYNRKDVEIIKDTGAYRGFFQIDLLQLRHRLFNGGWSQIFSRELFKRNDAVGVLLYDANLDAVALVEQFRVGVFGSKRAEEKAESPWMLELVAGIIDKKETPESTAIRESLEETGVRVNCLESVLDYYSSPGGSNEFFYLFAAQADLKEASGVHGLEEENEDIRVHIFPIEKFFLMLAAGELNNAQTIIAAQWLQANHQRLKQQWAS